MEEALTEARYLVQTASLSEPRLHEAFDAFQPDALLVELGADILALQHVRRVLREDLKARPVPIIVLAQSRHLNPAQFIVAADDFILPPYSSEEIVARIKLALWRLRQIDAHQRVEVGEIVVDLVKQSASFAGTNLPFTVREYQLFLFMATHLGRTFTRESLLAHVWGYEFIGDARVVDVNIKRMRSKLPAEYKDWVVTVRGVGYRLSEHV